MGSDHPRVENKDKQNPASHALPAATVRNRTRSPAARLRDSKENRRWRRKLSGSEATYPALPAHEMAAPVDTNSADTSHEKSAHVPPQRRNLTMGITFANRRPFISSCPVRESGCLPHVDLIVPAFRDSPYLAECLQSLAAQTYPAARVLVVTSTPSTFIDEVAKRFGVEVRVSPRPSGIASDWNFALECGTAPYLTICHQDDIYRADYCERMIGAIRRCDDALIAISDNTEHTAKGPRSTRRNLLVKRLLLALAFGHTRTRNAVSIRRRLLSFGNPVCCPSVMFCRRSLVDFRFHGDFRSNLDWDAWDRICRMPGTVAYVREPLVSHRVHRDSETTAAIATTHRYQEDRVMFARFWPDVVCRLLMLVYRGSYLDNRP